MSARYEWIGATDAPYGIVHRDAAGAYVNHPHPPPERHHTLVIGDAGATALAVVGTFQELAVFARNLLEEVHNWQAYEVANGHPDPAVRSDGPRRDAFIAGWLETQNGPDDPDAGYPEPDLEWIRDAFTPPEDDPSYETLSEIRQYFEVGQRA